MQIAGLDVNYSQTKYLNWTDSPLNILNHIYLLDWWRKLVFYF
jgi:hypothetical protein